MRFSRSVCISVALIIASLLINFAWQVSRGIIAGGSDAAMYAQAARQVANGEGMTTKALLAPQLSWRPARSYPLEYPIWTNKPLFIWSLAGMFCLFGARDYVLQGLCFASYCAATFVLFFFAGKWWGRRVAFLATMAFLWSPAIVEHSFDGRVESMFILLSLLLVFLALGWRDHSWFLIGVVGGLLILCRPNGALLALPVTAYLIVLPVLEQEKGQVLFTKKHMLRVGVLLLPMVVAVGWLLSFNVLNYGGALRFYDCQGWDFLEGPGLYADSEKVNAMCSHYEIPIKDPSGYLISHPEFVLGKLKSHIMYFVKNSYRFSGNPFVTLFALGVYFIPVPDRAVLRKLKWLLVAMIFTNVAGTCLYLPYLRIYCWVIPFFCLFFAIIVDSFVLRKIPRRWLFRVAVPILILILTVPVLLSCRATAETDAIGRDFWKMSRQKASDGAALTGPDALVFVNVSPTIDAWYSDRYSIYLPPTFEEFVSVIHKIRLPRCVLSMYCWREHYGPIWDDPGTWLYGKGGRYLRTLVRKEHTRFIYYIFEIDIDKVRKDFPEPPQR